jgi:hypothetical protein
MEFNSEKFVSEMTKVGMQKEQADLLAQACANFFSNPTVTSDDIARLEDRVRAERNLLEDRLNANHAALGLSLHKEIEAQCIVSRTQVEDIKSNMLQLEARIEGGQKSNLAAMKSHANHHSAGNVMLVISAMAGVYFLSAT